MLRQPLIMHINSHRIQSFHASPQNSNLYGCVISSIHPSTMRISTTGDDGSAVSGGGEQFGFCRRRAARKVEGDGDADDDGDRDGVGIIMTGTHSSTGSALALLLTLGAVRPGLSCSVGCLMKAFWVGAGLGYNMTSAPRAGQCLWSRRWVLALDFDFAVPSLFRIPPSLADTLWMVEETVRLVVEGFVVSGKGVVDKSSATRLLILGQCLCNILSTSASSEAMSRCPSPVASTAKCRVMCWKEHR